MEPRLNVIKSLTYHRQTDRNPSIWLCILV